MNRYKANIPKSCMRYEDSTGCDIDCVKKEDTNNLVESCNDLRLFSINGARKIFGIRHETLKKLIKEKKIGHCIIRDKVKIPFWCLKKFQEEQTKLTADQNNGKTNNCLTLNSIQDQIDFIINKYKD